MTKEEYYAEIESIARSIYEDSDVPEWLAAHTLDLIGGREPFFGEIVEDQTGDDSIHEQLDAYFPWMTIQEAANIIAETNQDPDHVDAGLYEGAGVTRMFVCIAFECYSWDVQDKIDELLKEDLEKAMSALEDGEDGEDGVNKERGEDDSTSLPRPYPSRSRQIGYYPRLRRFSHCRCAWDANPCGGHRRETHFFIVGDPEDFSLAKMVVGDYLYLCIEGSGVMTTDDTWIDAKRVYLQDMKKERTKRDIQDVLHDALCDGLVDHGWADELGPLPEPEERKEEEK